MYGYGYKYTSGLVIGAGGGAPFPNTKSLSFDGVDDRLALSSDFVASGDFTISFWMKPTSIAGNGDKYLIGQWPTTFANAILIDQLSRITMVIGGGSVFQFIEDSYGTNYIVLNTWQNITITRDSSNGVRCFRNGLDFGYSGTPIADANILTLNSIGRLYSNTYGFSGEFDEIAFLNTDETSNISTLATAPTVDLSSLNPTVWYRNGDGDTYPTITDNGSGGNDGTMTNMDAGDIVSDVPL